MSNYLAIATVTATLYDILTQSAQEVVPGARVTMDRPSDMANDRSGRPRINLYLYQIIPNTAWRNADLPTRRSDGAIVHSPQAAVNLQYLISFFGDETQFVPQRLLGKIVIALHSHPVLTRQEINSAIRELADAGQEYMRESDLADQIEQVKFSLLTVDLEELSGFWSALYQVPYSLSLLYQASVVLIEGPETPQPVLPVRQPGIRVLPLPNRLSRMWCLKTRKTGLFLRVIRCS
jgi:Pvc16 N-terminal domain